MAYPNPQKEKKMITFTKEELEKLTHLTVKQVSEKLGVRQSRVYRASKTYGLSFAKARPSREELEQLTHLTAHDIAGIYGVKPNTVSIWSSYYGLKFTRKEKEDRIKPSREELEKLTHLSQKQIAELYGVTKQSVSLWGKDYGLTFTPTKGQYRKIPMPSREEIKDLSLTEVVARYNVSITTAGKWRKQLDLLYKRPRREELEKLSHLRQIEIGQILGISQSLVSSLMRKYGITRKMG
jgi:predicted XRE-type DNA-binding protein